MLLWDLWATDQGDIIFMRSQMPYVNKYYVCIWEQWSQTQILTEIKHIILWMDWVAWSLDEEVIRWSLDRLVMLTLERGRCHCECLLCANSKVQWQLPSSHWPQFKNLLYLNSWSTHNLALKSAYYLPSMNEKIGACKFSNFSQTQSWGPFYGRQDCRTECTQEFSGAPPSCEIREYSWWCSRAPMQS